tara:strand:+ start:4798 stop:8193 length:3396 start_codon:yes stop_codon:yes gene_type:complete
MGFWSDLSMGLGVTPKTQDYVDRTARTIERTQGSNNASTYSNQMTNKVNENTGQNFQNNYTPSEGSQAVVNQFNDNDDNDRSTTTTTSTSQPDRSTMFGGNLKDYSYLNNNRFQANDLTSDGNMVGYSKYGQSVGSSIIITPEGKYQLNPSEAVKDRLGVAATDFDTLDEAFNMLDRFNDEPSNTFARYNAAIQQGLDDTKASIYANNTSFGNPSEVTDDDVGEMQGPVYEPDDLEGTSEPDTSEPFRREGVNYVEHDGKMVPEEVKNGLEMLVGLRDTDLSYDVNGDGKVDMNDILGFIRYGTGLSQDEATETFMQNFYTPKDEPEETIVEPEEPDVGEVMDDVEEPEPDPTPEPVVQPEPQLEPQPEPQPVVQPEIITRPVVSGTDAVYKPLPQTDSGTYTATPYDPATPTYSIPAQVQPQTTQFSPQYVAGPVQQTVSLPTAGTPTGQTRTIMYRNQRGQQIPITEIDGKPMTYVPPGYTRVGASQPFNQGGPVGYAEGGDTSLDAEYNLATKFLGYKGPKSRSSLNDFMEANPGAAARMGKYQQAMRGMYKGGVVYAYEGTDVGLTDGGTADAGISGEGDEYYDTTLPQFFDAVSQTMQPMQSTYSTIGYDPNQAIAGTAGQVGTYAPTVDAAQVGRVEQATTPTYTPTATYGAATTAGQVRDETGRLQPVAGQVSREAQVDAAQGRSTLDINAAQGTATMMTNPVTREIQSGELISGAADAQKAAKFTEQIQAAQATPSKQATVQGQLEGLMQQFEGGDTPAWAAGAMRNAMGAMAARGLGASSLAGQAAVQAAMESALPIAQADAQTIASFEAQNLSNRQQRAMLAAQQRAQFMGQEFDQAFQARVQNSARIADIANMNFTAEQQVALENSRAVNTMNLANLSNKQAGIMAEAAAIANMDMANLNNRQQAAVQNAQNFMAMDMSNLDRAQQTALFRSQQNIQAMFTDQAAENAALQFNASSENQTKQFFASLSSQTSQFNAAQTNAVNQFNVNSVNAIREFNANLQQQRDTFNATNGLVVAQANAQWRQNLATLNTAAANESNMAFAAAINGMTSKNIDAIWQRERDLMSYNITSVESGKDRALQVLLGEQTLEALREKIGYSEDAAESEFMMRFLFGDFGDLFD